MLAEALSIYIYIDLRNQRASYACEPSSNGNFAGAFEEPFFAEGGKPACQGHVQFGVGTTPKVQHLHGMLVLQKAVATSGILHLFCWEFNW